MAYTNKFQITGSFQICFAHFISEVEKCLHLTRANGRSFHNTIGITRKLHFSPTSQLPRQFVSWTSVLAHCSGRWAQAHRPGVKLWPQAVLEKVITDLNYSPELFPSLAPPGSLLSSAKQFYCFQVHSLQHERNRVDPSHKDRGGLVCVRFLSTNLQ